MTSVIDMRLIWAMMQEITLNGPVYHRTHFASPKSIRGHLLRVFFPHGYPHSVTPNFLEYCQWQFLYLTTGMVPAALFLCGKC